MKIAHKKMFVYNTFFLVDFCIFLIQKRIDLSFIIFVVLLRKTKEYIIYRLPTVLPLLILIYL